MEGSELDSITGILVTGGEDDGAEFPNQGIFVPGLLVTVVTGAVCGGTETAGTIGAAWRGTETAGTIGAV